jgi:hypothetical protein
MTAIARATEAMRASGDMANRSMWEVYSPPRVVNPQPIAYEDVQVQLRQYGMGVTEYVQEAMSRMVQQESERLERMALRHQEDALRYDNIYTAARMGKSYLRDLDFAARSTRGQEEFRKLEAERDQLKSMLERVERGLTFQADAARLGKDRKEMYEELTFLAAEVKKLLEDDNG